jgi:hypothetical protein
MITLTAKINLLGDRQGSLSTIFVDSDNDGNNISSGSQSILNTKKSGGNPFILGASKLGSGATFAEKVDYYIGSRPSDENGNFDVPYSISIGTTGKTSLSICFDDVNNQHPRSILFNGVEYADDDPIFVIKDVPASLDNQLYIYNWNAPHYPITIRGIYVIKELTIDKRNIISLSRELMSRGNISLPDFGIISNIGNLEFNDMDGEIRDYAEQMLLTDDLSVKIFLNNTLSKNQEQIGAFQTRDWHYDNDNRSVSVSLRDDLEEWQNIITNGLSLQDDPKSAYEVYNYLKSITPAKFKFRVTDEAETILQNTIIDVVYLESGNLWSQFQKLCDLCCLYIYKDNDGFVVLSKGF